MAALSPFPEEESSWESSCWSSSPRDPPDQGLTVDRSVAACNYGGSSAVPLSGFSCAGTRYGERYAATRESIEKR